MRPSDSRSLSVVMTTFNGARFIGPQLASLAGLSWVKVEEATTVAAALRSAGLWSVDSPQRRFDAEEWWWKTRLPQTEVLLGDELFLQFEGLAA